jgi:hypothetical protein
VFPGASQRAAHFGGNAYPNLIYFNKPEKGGHFMREEPEILVRARPAAIRLVAAMPTE